MAKKSTETIMDPQSLPGLVPELENPCKTLIANLGFAFLDRDVKTVCITSSVPNEGKTTLSVNLAYAMASAGNRTLLIENDLRRRSIGKTLGIHPENGLVSILRGAAKVSEAVVETKMPGLFFLDAESGVSNPSDVLGSARYGKLLAHLGKHFDYIVIDTPPTLTFVDSSIVASISDATVLAIRQDSTQIDAAQQSLEQLNQAKAYVVGAALTFCDTQSADYYYYYSYYYDENGNRKKGKRKKKHDQSEPREIYLRTNGESDDDWAKRMGIDDSGVEARKPSVRRQASLDGEDDAFSGQLDGRIQRKRAAHSRHAGR